MSFPMPILDQMLALMNQMTTLYLVFPSILLLGIYLSWQLGLPQVMRLKESFSCLLQKRKSSTGISHYEAVAAVLAGNFGTGNISGMAVALSTGGPGALVWMWVMAFLGASIQYASCVLGVHYRRKESNGEFSGGPMHYLHDGMKSPILASIFAVCTLFGAISVGNFAQIHSVTLPLQEMGISPLVGSVVLAIFVALVLWGGMQRVAKLAAVIVPVKALLYLSIAWVILFLHADQLVPALQLMLSSAFSPVAALGGGVGFSLSQAIQTGFDRGLFATDAGTGIVPILQSTTEESCPIRNGLATLAAPFLVMLVCTTTGLVLLVTGVWQQPDLKSTSMVIAAFNQGLSTSWGGGIVTGALLLFAYTTILAWACCGEKALSYLAGQKGSLAFKLAYVLLIPLGIYLEVERIWMLADLAIACMLLVNVVGIAKLSPQVIRLSSNRKKTLVAT